MKKSIGLVELDKIAEALIPHEDQILLDCVRQALPKIDWRVSEACCTRKIMPPIVLNALDAAYYLCRTVAAARAAEQHTGIPASLLLAEGMSNGYDPEAPEIKTRNDYFDTGKRFPGVGASFLFHARNLAGDKRLDPIPPARRRSLTDYLRQIEFCDRWELLYRKDLMSRIEMYGLGDLDLNRRS